ncbi:hypothetical protein P9139_08565 [Curtobacterium flaccumfaciens]|nr:hypothetical protein P9139_08565 [Curtobacterium flaccumfaciens]
MREAPAARDVPHRTGLRIGVEQLGTHPVESNLPQVGQRRHVEHAPERLLHRPHAQPGRRGQVGDGHRLGRVVVHVLDGSAEPGVARLPEDRGQVVELRREQVEEHLGRGGLRALPGDRLRAPDPERPGERGEHALPPTRGLGIRATTVVEA